MFETNGEFSAKYTLDGEHKELCVEVKLSQIDGLKEPRQNVWEGKAWVNDQPFKHPDLKYCVNAQLMADSIGRDEIDRLRAKYKEEGKSFRVKRKNDDNKRKSTNKKRIPADTEGVQRRTKKVGRPKGG